MLLSPTLIFRCDAHPAIGTGHIMRCVGLAQAWLQTGGTAVFIVAELPTGLENRLRAEGFGLIAIAHRAGGLDDAAATIEITKESQAAWVVVDGEIFAVEYLQALYDSGLRILLVDDFANRTAFPVHLILNPNVGVSDDAYRRKGSSARLLLGASHTPLRREFISFNGERRFSEREQRVLVTLGGSDPENLTPRIVDTLRTVDGLHLIAVAGASYEHRSELEALVSPNVTLVSNASNMPELMHGADLAITAAGGTLWELLYCRCPLVSYSRNPVQARVVAWVAKEGAAGDLGDTQNFAAVALARAVEDVALNRTVRQRMAEAGRLLIDGRGAERVIAAIQRMS
jgi:UDP-2,4-diacetamido-2,4,6-trideoxy-beta-L-altropyranose hydrolase